MASFINLDNDLKARIESMSSSRIATGPVGDKDQARRYFRMEAEASWNAYRKEGLHLAADETRAWLATWGHTAARE